MISAQQRTILVSLVATSCLTFADTTFAEAAERELDVETIFVLTYQKANRAQVDNEMQFSMDVEFDYSNKGSGWFGWIEFSSDPDNNEVTQFFDDANSDAGTTEDATGNGRMQFSSLYYYQNDEDASINWLFGLAEVTTLVDASEIANDEVAQFLTAGLVNNTTIAFPDYALSGRFVFNNVLPSGNLVFLISSGHGLADNKGNYGKTLNPFKNNQGVFVATEYQWSGEDMSVSTGIWRNSLADSSGWYSTIDAKVSAIELNARIGFSDINPPEGTSLTEDNADKQFAGLAIKYPLSQGELGIGWTYAKRHDIFDSRERNLEAYVRYPVAEALFITPSIQLHNGQLIEGAIINDTWISSLRIQQSF